MKINHLSSVLIIGLAFTLFTSCQKENIDNSIVNPEDTEVNTIVVNCNDWQMAIEGDAVGNFSANIDGGAAPFTYLWSTGETTQTATFVGEGTYSVTVTDADNCVLEDEITVTIDPCESFTGSVDQNPAGVYIATVNGGTAPYTYNWSNGETSNETFFTENGAYTLDIVDANACTLSFEFVVDIMENPCDNFVATAEFDPAVDVLTVNVTGGTEPYTYLWSLDGVVISTTQSIIDPPYGPYTVTVTDSNGCEVIDQFIETLPCNDLTATIQNPQANTLVADVSGGTQPYTYLWSTGETTPSITASVSGDYYLTLTDSEGCEAYDQTSL